MKRFTELCSLLSQASDPGYKEILISEYFDNSDDIEILWAMYLLAGRKLNKCINISEIWKILPELTGIPDWLIEESLLISGDKIETISLVLGDNFSDYSIPLVKLMNDDLLLNETEEKILPEKIINILKKISSAEKNLLLRLMSGNYRSPVKLSQLSGFLSRKYQINKLSANHLLGSFDPNENDLKTLISSYKKNKKIYKTYDFNIPQMSAIDDTQDINNKDWIAEWKWDGLRTQIIYRNGEFMLWSKEEELITEKFPEFFEFSRHLSNGIVIDGEIIAFSNGKPLPYNTLSGRLNKKLVSNKIINEYPAAFIAFDLLELDGIEITHKSLIERRALLEQVIEKIDQTGKIYLSPLLEFRNLKALNDIKNSATENNCNGLILKKKNSQYHIQDSWISIAREKYSIKGVLLYAQRDQNSSHFTDLTFGVWNNGELVTFTKAKAEFAVDELTELKAYINDNTIEKFGPVRTVKPELVFEIKFVGISESNRHKSGITLRNPQIHKWHKDKKPHEAGHLNHLKDILNAIK